MTPSPGLLNGLCLIYVRQRKVVPPGRFPFIHAWLFLVLQVLIVRPLLGSPRSEKSTIENQRMDADRRQALETPSADAGETYDETSAVPREANVSRSQRLTLKSHAHETINSPNGVSKSQSLKVSQVSQVSTSQVPAQPHLAFHKGQRVRTPEGDGEVLQYFRDRITVRLGERAALFVPGAVTPLEEAPF